MVYNLLNPYIEGSTKFTSNKKNASSAAEELWAQLSGNIKNYTPKFYFSIQEGGSKKVYHYKVKENMVNNKVSYTISNFDKNKKTVDKVLLDEIESMVQDGGKKKRKDDDDSSSDSSSSSSDEYVKFKHRQQSNMLSLTYYPTVYGVRNILLPTFMSSFTPYVNINVPLVSNNVVFV